MRKRKILIGVLLIGWYGLMAIAAGKFGWVAGLVAWLSGILTGIIGALADVINEEPEEDALKSSCMGCKNDLGGGHCRINMERECREGGGFELWEAEEDGSEENN